MKYFVYITEGVKNIPNQGRFFWWITDFEKKGYNTFFLGMSVGLRFYA